MNITTLKFHHLGLAVKTPDSARIFLSVTNYEGGKEVYDPIQLAHLQLYTHTNMPDVELIWPGEQSVTTPVTSMLKKRNGLIYHMCYTCTDVEKTIAKMEAIGLSVLALDQPKPAALFGGLNVSFYMIHNVGLIEIIHQDRQ